MSQNQKYKQFQEIDQGLQLGGVKSQANLMIGVFMTGALMIGLLFSGHFCLVTTNPYLKFNV